ncbi:hypothetical protein [Arenibacterium sp. LLYu02]|uniref:hypothetical protein n=1 Tax=Arenibacterium sp. LLYu02 TaxID=3404132 RepID=UPI003B20F381
MRRTVYLNGAFLPEDQAQISMFDRGFLMGDAVYEVTTVIEGKLIEFPAHMARLARSLGEVEIPFAVILRIAHATGLRVEERRFTLAEAISAEEAFITASPVFAAAVVEIDGTPIGTGTPGPITQALRAEHIRQSLAEAL